MHDQCPECGQPTEKPTRVITVRLTSTLHSALIRASKEESLATRKDVSLNHFCVRALREALEKHKQCTSDSRTAPAR
jgi:predicted HicB family RNase H-like nuclease